MTILQSAIVPSGTTGYTISRSVRLRSSASAYFGRTPAGAGNQSTWTWSGWVKRGTLGATYQMLFGADSGGGGAAALYFYNDNLCFGQFTTTYRVSTAVYRDPSAWYHVVCVLDTTQATVNNRVRIYVNGVEVTAFSTLNNPTQNSTLAFNGAVNHAIGADIPNTGPRNYLDGYLTEINFVNGQALTPSSFGQFDPITGVWTPKKYAGTYGTNGFYLNFSDNSAATAAAIGADRSGNGNNWTPNNISVTAGVTYDSMIDVPTPYADGSTNRGNYAVINPLSTIAFPVTNGNLSIGASTTANRCSKSSIAVSSGKWYWELKASAISASGQIVGVCSADALFSGGTVSSGYEVGYYSVNGNKYVNGTASAYGASWTTTDTIGVALDVDGGTVTFYKNNVSQGAISITAGQTWVADWTGQNVGDAVDFTFGQRPFTYTPPSGFLALNTFNLPTPTIQNGAAYMAATIWTGDGANPRTITNTVNGVSFQPDLVWTKARNQAYDNSLYDSVRGATNYLISNSTAAQASAANSLQAFNSDGFQVGGNNYTNSGSVTYVGWQWKAGGTPAVTNNNGSITSTVSVNATAGFSIVTYTGNGSSTASFGHGLGVAPSMVIIKDRTTGTSYWPVYHSSISSQYLTLNSTSAGTAGQWISTSSTVVSFSTLSSWTNTNTDNYVAYCWAAVAGYSAFGSYTGNGSTDGPFIFTNFRPRWILFKANTAGQNWIIFDAARSTYNVTQAQLYPNLSNAEDSGRSIDILSNGFKIRDTSTGINSGTILYACFAENPLKYSLAR